MLNVVNDIFLIWPLIIQFEVIVVICIYFLIYYYLELWRKVVWSSVAVKNILKMRLFEVIFCENILWYNRQQRGGSLILCASIREAVLPGGYPHLFKSVVRTYPFPYQRRSRDHRVRDLVFCTTCIKKVQSICWSAPYCVLVFHMLLFTWEKNIILCNNKIVFTKYKIILYFFRCTHSYIPVQAHPHINTYTNLLVAWM